MQNDAPHSGSRQVPALKWQRVGLTTQRSHRASLWKQPQQ